MRTLRRNSSPFLFAGCLAISLASSSAHAVSSAELYTSDSYTYGRVVARVQFPAGDGVVGSFFLWKDGSEKSGTFWNELDIEKLDAECNLETNAFFGNPGSVHTKKAKLNSDLCNGFHTYAYEWTPDYIAWSLDGSEMRRETGETAKAYSDNAASQGMQIRFNIWPGDASFGGTFRPSILPVYEYINWVEYYSYSDGAFKLEWREDFDDSKLSSRWMRGSWESPKGLSNHATENISLINGYAVLSLTADDALGGGNAKPNDSDGSSTPPDSKGAGGTSGSSASSASSAVGGATRSQDSSGDSSARGGSTSSSESTSSNVGGSSASSQTSKSGGTVPADDGGGCALRGQRRDSGLGGIALMMAAGAMVAFTRRLRAENAGHSGKGPQS